jgi:ribosomal protein S1
MGFDAGQDDEKTQKPEDTSADLSVGDVDDEQEDRGEDDMMANWADTADVSQLDVKEGEIREGIVVSVDDRGIIVDVGAKMEGFVPRSEFATAEELPKIDDKIEVAIVRIDNEHDRMRLSKKRADYERVWNELEELAKVHGTVQAMVVDRVKGGLRVDVGVPGFVPASHVGTRNLRNLERFVGRSLRLKVLEADRASKKAVLSHRELVEEERERRKTETLAHLEVGTVCEGKVRNITNYGAFVDLGGVDGLLHVSEMSWTRISHPSEAVKVGDSVRVIVLEIEEGGERISLSMRQIMPDPWKEAASKLRPGSTVKARITRVVRTGAFAQLLEAGIEGFIPIRELSEKRIADPTEVIQKDQEVDVKIMEIRKEARRMSLSLVAAEQDREKAEYREFMEKQESTGTTLGDRFGALLASVQTADESEESEDKDQETAGPSDEQ